MPLRRAQRPAPGPPPLPLKRSRAPAGFGPLQQIRTTGAAAGPARTAAPAITPAPGPGRAARPRAPRCAFCTRAGTFNCTSRMQNAHLECKMHISSAKCTSRRAQGRPAPASPRRPRPPPSSTPDRIHTPPRRPDPTRASGIPGSRETADTRRTGWCGSGRTADETEKVAPACLSPLIPRSPARRMAE